MASRTSRLAGLLTELETLRSTGGGSNSNEVTEHVKYIVDIVFNDNIAVDKVQSGSEKNSVGGLKSCLGLLRMAVDKFDGVFVNKGNGSSTVPFYFARLMQLFSLDIGRTCQDQLFQTLDKLLVSGATHDSPVLPVLHSGTCLLLSDVGEIVESMAAGFAPSGSTVVLGCFHGAKHHPASTEESRHGEDGDCLFISLQSEQTALAVTSACCRMMARIVDCSPLAVLSGTPPGALAAIGILAPSAREDDQVHFLLALRSAACDLCPCAITPARLLGMLEVIAEASLARGPHSPGAHWWSSFCSALELVASRLAESGCIQAVSPKLMSLLRNLSSCSGTSCMIKASLLSVVLLVVRAQPAEAPDALGIALSSWLACYQTCQPEDPCIQAVVAIFRSAVEEMPLTGDLSERGSKRARVGPGVGQEEFSAQPFIKAHCYPPADGDEAGSLGALSGLQLLVRATVTAQHWRAWDLCMPAATQWAQWAQSHVATMPLIPIELLLEAMGAVLFRQCVHSADQPMADGVLRAVLDIPLRTLVGSPWAQHVVKGAQDDPGAASEPLTASRQSALFCCILAWVCCHQQKDRLEDNAVADVASLCQSVLRRCLSDSNAKVRSVAVACVPMISVQIGAGSPPMQDGLLPRARGALRLLTECVADESLAVRVSVAKCLARLQACLVQAQYGTVEALADQLQALQTTAGLNPRSTFCSEDCVGLLRSFGRGTQRVRESSAVPGGLLKEEPDAANLGLVSGDLEPFWPLLSAGRERSEVRGEMINFCKLWVGCSQSAASLTQCKEAIKCCLDLSLSPSKSVRTAVSELVFVLVEKGCLAPFYTATRALPRLISGKEGELMFLKDMREQIEAHRQAASEDIRESLLACVAHACAAAQTREGLWMGLVMLVDTLDDKDPCLRARTGEMLHSVAAHRKIDVADLVTGQPRIMEYVGRRMASKPQLLGELADALELQETQLAERLVPSVLPRLVISQDTQLLGSLAVQLGQSLKDMLVNYGHHTVAYILLEGTQDIDEYAAFMNKHTGVEFDDLMRSSLRSVLREVMWCGGDQKRWTDAAGDGHLTSSAPPPELLENMQNNVLGCILRIHQGKDIPNDAVNAAVAEFLHKEQMVWLLTDLVGEKMKRAQEVEPAEQTQALRCLALLVVFIDFHLADFVPIVMTLLACATEAVDLTVRVHALGVWRLFIRQLREHAPEMLKINAVPIAVILSSCLEEGGPATQAAAPAMEELVLQNAEGLAEVLCEFPPLPSVSVLSRVNEAIASARGDMSAPEQLHTLGHGLVPNRPGHYAAQPLAVKAVTLMEIKRFLQQHQEWRGALAGGNLQSGNAMHWHGALDFLVAVLLKSCDPEVRSALSSRVQLRCGECLGALGAVDPSKLDSVDNLKGALSKAQTADKICRTEQDLAHEALKCLVRLLSGSSDLAVLEAANFGIQELLRYYGGDLLPSAGEWSLFSAAGEDLQPILRPYLSTKYQMQQTIQSFSVPSPIFGMAELSFRRWLFLWIKQLTDSMPTTRSTVLRSCLGVARHDIPIMMLLLPHAVLLAVADGSLETVDLIASEIQEVLQCGSRLEPTQVDWQLFLQAIFTLLDRLHDWVARMDVSAVVSASHNSRTPSSAEPAQGSFDSSKETVEALLKAIDKRVLAKAAFRCKAHARATQYFEAALRDGGMGGGLNPASKNASHNYGEEDVSFLIDIYSELEEPDGLSGLIRLRKGGPTNSDMILAAERRGSWGEALTLYEQALQQEERSELRQHADARDLTRNQAGHLTCLLHMGHLQAVLTQAEGLAAVASSSARTKLAVKAVAAAWRLGRWEVLEDCLKAVQEQSSFLEAEELWEVRLGQLIASIRSLDVNGLHAQLRLARQEIMAPMSAAAMESHSRAYPHVVRLHMLQEIQDAVEFLPALRCEQQGATSPPQIQRALQRLHWPERLACTQVSLATQEPILALRRQLAVIAGLPDQEGTCWLMLARLSRKTGHLDTAAISCLEAITRGTQGALLEHAKLLWTTGDTYRAISTVQEALDRNEKDAADGPTCSRTKTKLLLQMARWVAVTGQGGKDQVVTHFHNAIQSGKTSEKNFFYYGKYLDQLMQDAKRRQLEAESSSKHVTDRLGGKSKVVLGEEEHYLEILPEVVQNYALSVKHGHKLIMQSLPRLLTLWYDFGSQFHIATKRMARSRNTSLEPGQEEEYQLMSTTVEKVKSVMADACANLPVYSWLMVLSQLISRTCHPNPAVSALTKDIIITVTEAYPQQAVWALVAVSRSKFKQRSKSATEILNTAKKRILSLKSTGDSQLKEVFSQFPALVDHLIHIANYKPEGKIRRFDLTREGGLSHVTRMNPNAVILPVLDMLTPELPSGGVADGSHNAFSGRYTTIDSIRKEVDVMASLQRPKKIVFNGSDGQKYMFLAKPNDDLRKDHRLMELATTLNRLFVKHPASRQRNLYLRTFNVVPLTEDCGIIQWVNYTIGLRYCCGNTYVGLGLQNKQSLPTIKRMYESHEKSGSRKWTTNWYNEVMDMFPPVLHNWFLKVFATPAHWANARLRLARTTAVWSMVGHVLGLGDRHGENLLIDKSTGDCVHVDFSCLFDKGLTLEKPEMVPFRLTQNLVDAFGPSGVEGVFRSACGITLQVLRAHRETILSILETFVHDPLVEWNKSSSTHRESGDSDNPQARDALRTTEGRLLGTLIGVSSRPSLPLSVEGHAHRLIEEAVDHDNLGRMYVWWMIWY